LALIGAFVVVFVILMETTTYDIWGGLVIAPILIAATVPMLRHQARREADPRAFSLLFAGILVHFLGAVARYVLGFLIYDNKGDAYKYHLDAIALVERWASGHIDLRAAFDTPESFITHVAALGQVVFRPSVLAGFLLFSWFSFLGLFWLYRAFCIAAPEGRPRTYAKLLFFLPSLLFWPSSIGKEAWMLFALGITALGVAHLLTARAWRGLCLLGVGMLGLWAVRPHYAGIVAIALVCAFLIKRPSPAFRQLAPIVKLGTLVVAVVAAGFFLRQAQDFLSQSGLDVPGGLTSIGAVRTALGEATVQTEQGGSQFRTPGLTSPGGVVLSVGTVLYRPLPIEASDPQILLAAVESTFLLVLTVVRYRWVIAALKSFRRQPYIAFLASFLAGGVLVLTSVANFGILARQRTLILPAMIALISIPPLVRRSRPEAPAVEDQAALEDDGVRVRVGS
jgi:hypothetical protein